MPPKSKEEKSVHEALPGSAEHARRMEMEERKEERQILDDLIKADIGLSQDRVKALKKIFKNPPANMTKEELQLNEQQRLEGMAEMAMVRLNHAKSASAYGKALAAKNTNPNANLYEVYGYPEEEGYTKAFPKVEGE